MMCNNSVVGIAIATAFAAEDEKEKHQKWMAASPPPVPSALGLWVKRNAGRHCVLSGLQKVPEFNGMEARLISYDESTERATVVTESR
jgi:hypothetical protein